MIIFNSLLGEHSQVQLVITASLKDLLFWYFQVYKAREKFIQTVAEVLSVYIFKFNENLAKDYNIMLKIYFCEMICSKCNSF